MTVPELPEVETVRRTLAPALGAEVAQIWTSGKTLHHGRPVEELELARAAMGARLEAIRRLGKYLLLDFADREYALVIHLGMSGRLRLHAPKEPVDSHVHARFRLRRDDGGTLELRFRDPRRFGLITSALRGREREHPALARLGIDPLEARPEELARVLWEKTRGRHAGLKAILLDQRIIAGIGNIYASEALWQAKLDPELPAYRLGRARAARLAEAIVCVLARALQNGGTSLRDFVAADGASGEHAHYLWVYARAGAACPRARCDGSIARRVLQGRATFVCPRCQRRGR